MKTKLAYLLVLTLTAISCQKDESQSFEEVKNLIPKEWFIPSDDQYISFEFYDNNKYVVRRYYIDVHEDYLSSGNYTLSSDGKTLNLGRNGTISIISVSKDRFDFKIDWGGSSHTLSATPSKAISSTQKTALLCRKWNLEKQITRSFFGTLDTILQSKIEKPIEVTFSKYGTAVISNSTRCTASFWGWNDNTQTVLYLRDEMIDSYSGYYYGVKNFSVEELTDTSLVLKHNGDNEMFDYRYYKCKK